MLWLKSAFIALAIYIIAKGARKLIRDVRLRGFNYTKNQSKNSNAEHLIVCSICHVHVKQSHGQYVSSEFVCNQCKHS